MGGCSRNVHGLPLLAQCLLIQTSRAAESNRSSIDHRGGSDSRRVVGWGTRGRHSYLRVF